MLLQGAIVFLCMVLVSSSGEQLASKGYISHQFKTSSENPFLHFALNNRDGKVYVSAVNRIYQLDKNMDLSTLIEVSTGPVNDSDKCLPNGQACDPSAVLELRDNYNKLLTMDIERNKLYICGSVYQGLCEARSLSNINQILSESHCMEEEKCTLKDLPVLSCLDEVCTTLAVIAEGPTVHNPVLYVATTVVDSVFRNENKNSVSTRSLHIDPAKENKLFLWAVDDGVRRKSFAVLDEEPYTKYFKYGFSTDGLDGFVYFLYQKIEKMLPNTITTTIARVCKKDVFFQSYVEMKLTCDGLPQDQNGELVGAFFQKNVGKADFSLKNIDEGVLYVMYKNGTSSSLCIYTIENLNQAFDNTVLSCYKHQGKDQQTGETIAKSHIQKCDDPNAKWMAPDATLDDTVLRADTAPSLPYYKDFTIEVGKIRCGAYYLPAMLERLPEVPATWSYHHDGVSFSTITVDLINDVNVAHIGTEEGKVIELDVNHKNNYNTIDIGKPILSDLTLDDNLSLSVPHLYVMTSLEVFHIKVSICKRHKTCSDCLGARDPYCGWCILESRCMPKSSQCPANGWLKPLSEQCIEASVPEPLERTLQQDLLIKVKLLPSLTSGDNYECLFNGLSRARANVHPTDSEVLVCTAPSSDSLPESMDGEDYVNVTLSIVYNNDVTIVSTEATFYECKAHGKTINRFQPCQSCLVNRWQNKCSWCIASHACVPVGTRKCLTSSLQCPMVTTAAENSVLLPVGIETDVVVNVMNLPSSATDMRCRVQIDGENPFEMKATPIGDSKNQVQCDSQTYKYSSHKTEVPANVTVYWQPGHIVDVQDYNPVSFYNCSIEYRDCSLCVTSKPEYKCGWCGSRCVVQNMCDKDWITDAEHCPSPEIKSFSPTSGPIAGNTMITIVGTNMGVDVSDVQGVSVGGVPCQIQEELYEISNKVVCVTGTAPEKLDGTVSVTVRGMTKLSIDKFHYRNPVLKKVSPTEGPIAGGIEISITGSNLNTGLLKTAYIGDKNQMCELLTLVSNTEIKCKIAPVERPNHNLTVFVELDGYPVRLWDAFSYIENPTIFSYTTASDKVASFMAGGRDIVFKGKRLQLVQNAQLMAFIPKNFLNQNLNRKQRRKRRVLKNLAHYMLTGERYRRSLEYTQFNSPCSVKNYTTIICPSPEISKTFGDDMMNISEAMYVAASLRLMMDNINLQLENEIKYYPNPVVEKLDPGESDRKTNGSLLKIKVRNLNEDAIQKQEIIIMINGEHRCVVDTINSKGSVNCIVPPKPDGEKASFPVTVKMGNKIWDNVGEISYLVSPPAISEGLKIGLIVGGIILAIVVGIGVFYFVRKQKHYKENKSDFKKTIENLEMTVQADFRKAFAELSIDMTDLTADIGDVGLPILNYRQYATNMFFPSVRYHPCMKEPDSTETPNPGVHQGFVQFDLLITNKQFLMSFVRTLEQQRGFSNRDKGNVASLITVVLHKKLDYFTEVMKSLIAELVVQSVQRNPKLVLRRTESVAERMFSNWLAICLFPYIRDTAGKPLFLLQKAIKHQVSKGALDAVTGKTRYTLSDDSLLKEDVPCDSLTLFVSQSENLADEPIIVKVLSCDTILQVKEKIMDTVYKRLPFSARPKAEQLDMEWRHGRSGHLVLPDNDYTNEPGSRWRRVMTIRDYKVENNATMALVPRQQKSDVDVVNQFTNQTADASVISPMLPDDNMKTYHLVKFSDDIEQKRESTILRDKHKHILDLYLLRLINMKGILQNYVDEVFQAILDTESIPSAVKHFFDFLDELAKTNGIEDPEILHIWKTNSVLGRFWVTILKNPGNVFDIDKPESVESSMAVISQTFIDACSVQEHKPTKDSPINKQLYAKEIPTYKRMVQKYYQDVQEMQPVSDQDMCAHMTEISRTHNLEFDVNAAHCELWAYVNKYYEEIHETLSNDDATQMVIQRLQQAYTLIDTSTNNP